MDKCTQLTEFDGRVVVERSDREVSARCHDDQANFLALNLMHAIVTAAKSVQQARENDAKAKKPTPYVEALRFTPEDASAADPDVRVRSDEYLEAAAKDGKERE